MISDDAIASQSWPYMGIHHLLDCLIIIEALSEFTVFNSLMHGDTYMRPWSGSSLVQVMG